MTGVSFGRLEQNEAEPVSGEQMTQTPAFVTVVQSQPHQGQTQQNPAAPW